MAVRKARKRNPRKKTARHSAVVPVLGCSDLALPAELQDEFAPFINRDRASAVAAGWPYASTQGSTPIMTLSGQPIGDEKGLLEAVILGGIRMNQYYEGDFTPGKPTPPVCYAIADPAWESGEIETKLAPPTDLPSKQSDTCAACRWNAFGSGRGNAKACKNTVRLALLPADAEDFSKVDGLMLSVPPTGLRAWSAYVAPLTAIKRPVMSMVTQIEKVPNTKGAGFALRFTTLRAIHDTTVLRALLARAGGDGGAALVQPPPTAGVDGADGATPGRRGPRRRKVIKAGRGR